MSTTISTFPPRTNRILSPFILLLISILILLGEDSSSFRKYLGFSSDAGGGAAIRSTFAGNGHLVLAEHPVSSNSHSIAEPQTNWVQVPSVASSGILLSDSAVAISYNHTYDVLSADSTKKMNRIASKFTYYRFTEEHYEQHFVATRNHSRQLLFVPPFTQFFSLRQLTSKFDFLSIVFNRGEVKRLFQDFSVPTDDFSQLQSSKEYTSAMSWILMEMLNTTAFAADDYVMCHENAYPWFQLGWNAPNRQYVVSKSYFCCDHNGNCGWQIQSLLFAMCHVIFAGFNVAFALVVMYHVTKTRRIFFMKDENEAKFVTNSFWNPPFWLSEMLPARDSWATDIRNWTSISMLTTLGGLFILNFVHLFVPVEFPRSKFSGLPLPIIEASQFFGSIKIGGYSLPGMFLWALFLLPTICVLNVVTTIIKLRAPRFEFEKFLPKKLRQLLLRRKQLRQLTSINGNDSSFFSNNPGGSEAYLKQYFFKIARLELRLVLASLFERLIRILFAMFISLIMTTFVFIFLLVSFELYEFNDFFVLSQAFVVWIIGTLYLHQVRAIVEVSPRAIIKRIKTFIIHNKRRSGSGPFSALEGDTPQGDEELPLLDEDAPSAATFERLDDPESPSNKPMAYLAGQFVLRHLLPTVAFEGLWFGSVMILSFIAGSIITRLIWSLLLLFIIYTDMAQVAVYLVTLCLTVGKYVVELSRPHNQLKTMIMDSKPSVSRASMEKWNAYMLERQHKDPKYLDEAILSDKDMKYLVMISWKSFFEIADACNVSYFIHQSMMRAIFSLFVITLFFMATVIFGSTVGDDFSQFLKIGAVVLMPLIPNFLALLETKNTLEESIFKSRFRSAMAAFENTNCPEMFKFPFTSGKYKIACSACTWKVQHRPVDLVEPQRKETVSELMHSVREELERSGKQ